MKSQIKFESGFHVKSLKRLKVASSFTFPTTILSEFLFYVYITDNISTFF